MQRCAARCMCTSPLHKEAAAKRFFYMNSVLLYHFGDQTDHWRIPGRRECTQPSRLTPITAIVADFSFSDSVSRVNDCLLGQRR
jgi:hypothetical protein